MKLRWFPCEHEHAVSKPPSKLGHKELNAAARYLTITTVHKAKAMEIFQVAESDLKIIDIAAGAVKVERQHNKDFSFWT